MSNFSSRPAAGMKIMHEQSFYNTFSPQMPAGFKCLAHRKKLIANSSPSMAKKLVCRVAQV